MSIIVEENGVQERQEDVSETMFCEMIVLCLKSIVYKNILEAITLILSEKFSEDDAKGLLEIPFFPKYITNEHSIENYAILRNLYLSNTKYIALYPDLSKLDEFGKHGIKIRKFILDYSKKCCSLINSLGNGVRMLNINNYLLGYGGGMLVAYVIGMGNVGYDKNKYDWAVFQYENVLNGKNSKLDFNVLKIEESFSELRVFTSLYFAFAYGIDPDTINHRMYRRHSV
jgi:hypothetical protein